jgi:hypothetical protein
MRDERALTASRLSGARMTDPRAPAHRPRQGTAAQIDGFWNAGSLISSH